jgi:hypothetical protein
MASIKNLLNPAPESDGVDSWLYFTSQQQYQSPDASTQPSPTSIDGGRTTMLMGSQTDKTNAKPLPLPHGYPQTYPAPTKSYPSPEFITSSLTSPNETTGDKASNRRHRRRFDEVERYYQCNHPGCSKSYGTLNHLNSHVTIQVCCGRLLLNSI